MEKNYFTELYAIDCSAHTEKKGNLTYLSWPWAWAEIKKLHPLSFYTVYENKDGLNYHTDGRTAWVKTGVTVVSDDASVVLEHIEYLPVMDSRNRSIPLDQVTSFDVNKAIQRSLTKAAARHGLGLYIYAGEDLPEDAQESAQERTAFRSANPSRKAPKRSGAKSEASPEVLLTEEHKEELICLAKERFGAENAGRMFLEITGIRNLNTVPDQAFETLKKKIEEEVVA